MMLNPVFRREVRTVLRTWKTFGAISVYVLLLTAVTGVVLAAMLVNIMYSGFNPSSSTTIYTVMAAFQLGLIMLVVPAITGGAINGERERQTLDLMLVTKMSTFSIIFGKLTASLVLVLLMIMASLPVFGVVIYYGGVNVVNLFTMALFFLATAAMVGSLSIFFSALFKRQMMSIVATYIVILFLSLGNVFSLYIFARIIGSMFYFQAPPVKAIYAFLAANPFVGFVSLKDSQLGTFSVNSFIEQMTWSFNYSYYGAVDYVRFPLWIINAAMDLVISAVFVALSAFIIRPAKKSKMYK